MTGDQSNTIETMRARYLGEYKHLSKKGDRLAFFEEIAEIAAATEAQAWKRFADGSVALCREEMEVALTQFEDAISLDPAFAYPWNGKGGVLYEQKRYDEALAAYEKAISLDPEFAYPWNGKGTVLWEQKRYDEALAAFEKAISLDPEYAYPWNGKGTVLSSLKRYDEALAAFEKAIALDPEDAAPWNGKGNVLSTLKRYDEALAAYEKAIALDPEFAQPWNAKGNVLVDQNRYDEALAAYEKAIALDPGYAAPWNGKGGVLYAQKHYDEALAACEKAISLDSEYAHPWNNKGIVLYAQNRYDEALAAYEKAISLDPEFAESWNGKGSVLGEQKRYDEALPAFEKAIFLDAEYAHPHYNLGVLQWHCGRYDNAAEAFRRAVVLGPDTDWVEAARSWIVRAEGMIASERAGQSAAKREETDRSSAPALVTDLFEEMEDDLPGIRKKKLKFKESMDQSVGKPRLIGMGGADDLLFVLRDWNSFSPLLRRELRDREGPGPEERLGGGYFLVWRSHGIAIDPGADFVTQLYRKGLSIADVDTVVITHCHLDHTRDVESLVDLNYRYNKARGLFPHAPDTRFRQLNFRVCDSALLKYAEYLKTSGCCRHPTQLARGGDATRLTDFIEVQATPAEHEDINGRNDEAIGLVFSLKDEKGLVRRVGMTSDTKWTDALQEHFSGCSVLVAHLGTIEVGEEKPATPRNPEQAAGAGEAPAEGGFLTTDLKNHLGTKGCFQLLQQVKPKLFVIGEFGEELVETRFKIIQVLHRLRPADTRFVLGGDSNLAIGLGEELTVCCSHPECARSWTRIPLDELRPVLGGDFLFQYTCSRHEIAKHPPD